MEAISSTLGLNWQGLLWHAINFVVLLVLLHARITFLAWAFVAGSLLGVVTSAWLRPALASARFTSEPVDSNTRPFQVWTG